MVATLLPIYEENKMDRVYRTCPMSMPGRHWKISTMPLVSKHVVYLYTVETLRMRLVFESLTNAWTL